MTALLAAVHWHHVVPCGALLCMPDSEQMSKAANT